MGALGKVRFPNSDHEIYCSQMDFQQADLPLIQGEEAKSLRKYSRRVGIIDSEKIIQVSNRLPKVRGRASRVSSLIQSYHLLGQVRPLKHRDATLDEMTAFHSQEYIAFLSSISKCEDIENLEEAGLEFGLGFDCPILPRLLDVCLTVAGGSISAAEALVRGEVDVAINWHGGWHHAQRDNAEGFCYVNDIVLSIHELRKKFDRVLYIDLDVHHGNGVENAFAFSAKVFTLSLHLLGPGFYPGTGTENEIGFGKGKYFCMNIPLQEGTGDDVYCPLFFRSFMGVYERFKPDAIVCQCGADSLFGDPLGGFNLSGSAILKCLEVILATSQKPLLLLGGGGYNFPNTAKLWTKLTALVIGMKEEEIPIDIPDCDPYFLEYGPTYELIIEKGRQKETNSAEYVSKLVWKIQDSLQSMSLNS